MKRKLISFICYFVSFKHVFPIHFDVQVTDIQQLFAIVVNFFDFETFSNSIKTDDWNSNWKKARNEWNQPNYLNCNFSLDFSKLIYYQLSVLLDAYSSQHHLLRMIEFHLVAKRTKICSTLKFTQNQFM